MAELLLEIGTEEIPARMLRQAESDLRAAVEALLRKARLDFAPLVSYSAPRQLVVLSATVDARQQDREETLTGPPVRIAYDGNGKPTRALEGFLRKNPTLNAKDLFEMEEKKGAVVAGRVRIPGRDTRDILAEALPAILDGLHFAKNMRWGSCATRFVRPVRSLLALFDGAVVPFRYAGVAAGDHSFGHRRSPSPTFQVRGIDQYLEEKRKRHILVSRADRRAAIEAQIRARLAEIGGRLVPDEELLEEITDLVEIPHVVIGTFDPAFLAIPREVLITSLRDHQKSFTVQADDGSLMPYFLSIANVVEDGKGLIREGNQWVLRARLYDAKFFWESDLKKSFEGLRDRLENLVFQARIGSYRAKTARMAALAETLAAELMLAGATAANLIKAATHCKNDLVSEMVFEFPELQGITGGLLLEAKGAPEEYARAVYEHYLPYSMDGALPASKAGALVSLVDKLDTLVGCFAVGLIPKGARDPYALRRAAQGIVRILVEHELPLSLDRLLSAAMAAYDGVLKLPESLAGDLRKFFQDRTAYYLKREGFDHDLIQAVLTGDSDRVDQTLKRAKAVDRQQSKPSFRTLALNLKRMNNVIADELDRLPAFREDLLQEGPEIDLWQRFERLRPVIAEAVAGHDYNTAMDTMNELSEPVERYFSTDGVFVNCEDDALRLNRKAMLKKLALTIGQVADISYLETKPT